MLQFFQLNGFENEYTKLHLIFPTAPLKCFRELLKDCFKEKRKFSTQRKEESVAQRE